MNRACTLFLLMFLGCGTAMHASAETAPTPTPPPAATPAPAPPPAPKPATRDLIVPELPSADMRMSWNDFKELLVRIQKPQEPVTPPEEAVPLPWALVSAKYKADATLPGSVRVEGVIDMQVWKKGWVQIPVLGANVALESALLDGAPSMLSPKGDWFEVLLNQTGLHTLTLVFHLPAQNQEGVVSFEFPCAATPVTQMQLALGIPAAQVTAPAASSIRTEAAEKGLAVDMIFRSSPKLGVQWQLPAAAIPKKPEPEKEPPRVTCFGTTLAMISENHMACENVLQYDVLRGEINRFLLRLPAQAQVLRVEGTGVEWTAKQEGDLQTLTINVNHAVKDHFPLTVACETAIPAGAAAVTVPAVEALEVVRQTGLVAVATTGNIEVEAHTDLPGLTRVDTADLPAALKSQSTQPILHAFRYAQGNYALSLDYRKLEDVPVRIANIDRARITSVITAEGLLLTRAEYIVRNNLKKFLQVDVGSEAEVWGAQVGGKVVRPARSDAGKEEKDNSSAVLIPLLKSNENGKTPGSFAVELVYMRRMTGLGSWWDKVALDAPRTDILADRVEWEIFVPDDKRVFRYFGDMKTVARFGGARLGADQTGAGENMETIYKLREGVERFLITDINNPAAVPQAKQAAPANQPAPAHTGEKKPVDATVAGVLPIAVSLPKVGYPYRFERVIVPQATPLHMTLYAYDTRILRGVTHAARLVAFLAGLFAATILYRRLRQDRNLWGVAIPILVALIALTAGSGITGLRFMGILSWMILGALTAGTWQTRKIWGASAVRSGAEH